LSLNIKKLWSIAWALAVIILVSDQWTKWVIRANFELGELLPVIPNVFNITYVQNRGAAWGMLSQHTSILAFVSLAMFLLMVIFRRKIFTDHPLQILSFGLLLGGIVGNLIDRFYYKFVTDFIMVYIYKYEWPTFNIADSAICVAVTLYIISSYKTIPEAKSIGDEHVKHS